MNWDKINHSSVYWNAMLTFINLNETNVNLFRFYELLVLKKNKKWDSYYCIRYHFIGKYFNRATKGRKGHLRTNHTNGDPNKWQWWGITNASKDPHDKFELTFGNNQSIWQHVDEEQDNDEFGGNGMQIRMVGPGQNDIAFYDFTNARKVEQREMFDKNLLLWTVFEN